MILPDDHQKAHARRRLEAMKNGGIDKLPKHDIDDLLRILGTTDKRGITDLLIALDCGGHLILDAYDSRHGGFPDEISRFSVTDIDTKSIIRDLKTALRLRDLFYAWNSLISDLEGDDE